MKKSFFIEEVIESVKLELIKDGFILKKFIDQMFIKYLQEDAFMHLAKIMKPNFDSFISPYSVEMKVSIEKKEKSFLLECLVVAIGETQLEDLYLMSKENKEEIEKNALEMEAQALDFFQRTLYTQIQGILINAQNKLIEHLKVEPELKNNPGVLVDRLLIDSFGLPAIPIKFNKLFNENKEYIL